MNNHFCYILKNLQDKTYNGYSVNLSRRIRQHNQEISGGAKFTKMYGNKDWEMYVVIGGFPNKNNALQCEWRIKHPENRKKTGSKYKTSIGKIKGLNIVMNQYYWTNNSTILNTTLNLTIFIIKDYAKYLEPEKFVPNINIIQVDKIDFEEINKYYLENSNLNQILP